MLELTLEKIVGGVATLMVSLLEPMHPKGVVPVTVYTVVEEGLTVKVESVIAPGFVV